MDKNGFRDLMIKKRRSIHNKEELSIEIINRIIDLDIYKKSKIIAIYNSMNEECSTKILIDKALLEKIVLLPKIEDDEMFFVRIRENTKYIKSKFKVMEPLGEIYNNDIDLIIVPGVSFDESFNRLGYGKGYYDKFLKNKNIFKLGICFEEQLVSNLPIDEWDIKVDMIITEKKILKKV